LGKRVAAWLDAHDISPTAYDAVLARFIVSAIRIHPEAEDLGEVLRATVDSYHWRQLVASLDHDEKEPPLFIIVDTLARCFEGDENQQEDMGAFVKALDFLREDYAATVLVIHHTNADESRERGNTSLRGAADTMMTLKHNAGEVTVTCNKQKDWEPFEPIELAVRPAPARESLVLELAQAREDREVNEKQALVVAYFEQNPTASIRKAAKDLRLSDTSVWRIRKGK
jgi:hypothetical protein